MEIGDLKSLTNFEMATMINNLRGKIDTLQKENERLSKLNKTNCDNLSKKIIIPLREKINTLQKENEELREENQRITSDNYHNSNNLEISETENTKLKKENEELNNLRVKYSDEASITRDAYTKKCIELTKLKEKVKKLTKVESKNRSLLFKISELQRKLKNRNNMFLKSKERVKELGGCLKSIIDYENDSNGIEGYHLNGNILTWDEMEEITIAKQLLKD
jgi:FtsZ-binding cell division protein ZapB